VVNTDARTKQLQSVLLTSGLGGIFPRGYPVARVVVVKRLPGEKFLWIKGEPTVSWDDTHYLLVLKRERR
jgi:rod shape-determining protein MreC